MALQSFQDFTYLAFHCHSSVSVFVHQLTDIVSVSSETVHTSLNWFSFMKKTKFGPLKTHFREFVTAVIYFFPSVLVCVAVGQ